MAVFSAKLEAEGGNLATETAIFRSHPITIESEGQNNGSAVTLTSRINDPNFTTQLMEETQRWCDWVEATHGREANARLDNNQITCTLDVPMTQGSDDLSINDVLPELVNRLKNQTGRSMTAGVGDTGTGGTGEEDYEEIRGT